MTDKSTHPRYTGVEIVIHVFQALVQFTLYHSIACLITGVGRGENWEMYLRMGVLLLPLLLYSFTRAYVGNLFLFVLIHLGSAWALLWIVPRQPGEAAAMFGCLVVMLVNSVRFRIIESYRYRECPNLLMLLLIFLVYALAAYTQKALLMKLCFYELIVFIFFYLISSNLENTEKFIHINRDTANFPVRQMKWVNRMLLCFFAVVLVVGMLLAPQLHPELLAEKAGNVILHFLRWFFSHIQFEEMNPELFEKNVQRNPAGMGMGIEEGTPSKIALFLQNVFLMATQIFLIVGMLAAVGFGLYQIYKRFYALPLKNAADREGKDVVTVAESIPVFRKKKEREEKTGGNSKKIRRLYKKSVKRRRGKEQILSQTLTPTEIEEALKQPSEEAGQRKRRIALYEKARYSKEECTREELEEIRKMV